MESFINHREDVGLNMGKAELETSPLNLQGHLLALKTCMTERLMKGDTLHLILLI
jgi:hypothetical protein